MKFTNFSFLFFNLANITWHLIADKQTDEVIKNTDGLIQFETFDNLFRQETSDYLFLLSNCRIF